VRPKHRLQLDAPRRRQHDRKRAVRLGMQLPEPRGQDRHVLCSHPVLAPRPVKYLAVGIGARAGHGLEILLEFSTGHLALGRDDDTARARINQPIDRHDGPPSAAVKYASMRIAS
jgi:hypothetical protein